MSKFKIEYWGTEQERNMGLGAEFSVTFSSLKKAIEQGKDLFHNQNMAAVEVVKNGRGVWSITKSDIKKYPEGEYLRKYYKKK